MFWTEREGVDTKGGVTKNIATQILYQVYVN